MFINRKLFAAAPPKGRPSPGGSCGGGGPIVACVPDIDVRSVDALREGSMPVVYPLCPTDVVLRTGRTRYARAHKYVMESVFARGTYISPAAPLRAQSTKGAGALTLTVSAPAAAGPTSQGYRYLVFGGILEVGSSNNVTPGTTKFALSGTFEDGTAFEHSDIQVQQSASGYSRFLVLFTKEVDGGAYPAFVSINNDYKVVLGGTAIALTAGAAPNDATSATPTNGIQMPDADLTVDIETGPQNTEYAFETLSPSSEYYNFALAVFLQGLKEG